MKVKELIEQYSILYSAFEELQEKKEILPKGDQKTGVIGEYYAKCYAATLAKHNTTQFAAPGDSYDLRYIDNVTHKEVKVQVKCVSHHSKTRTLAPLNLKHKDDKKPFDYLYLISLDNDFIPDGFYINSYEDIERRIKEKKGDPIPERISGLKMKSINTKGSSYLDFSMQKKDDLKNAIAQFAH